MPPYGPRRSNPFGPPPAEPRRRPPRWLAAALLPAVVGAGVALAVVALTGNLGGDTTTVIERDTSPLPAASAAVAESTAARPAAGGGVQAVVARSAPAVVKVTSGEEGLGGRLGSGFLVDRRGRILTNAHVLGDEDRATVTFDDGTESPAEVLGVDESTDLAVLRAEDVPPDVRPLPPGRSAGLTVGDPVIAIGNPFGLERTATTGIVSALKRIINAPNDFEIQNVIQTDAAINQGNSGGPLLDGQGRVVGINSQIASESGGNDGIGFAVPIDTIRPIADAIIATGEARHAWLGITGRQVTPEIAEALGAPDVRGVAVVSVDERGPAKDAGLRPATTPDDADVPRGGDLIVAVDGREVRDMADVSLAVSSRAVGDGLALTVLRDGARVDLRVTLADRPDDVGVAAGQAP
ncbi:MAG TPA: trypsin-like peptidase domain-containing protein [Miltoncostaeaceae bacterium]|nr:trypsin-like peptidase domain-containing protein [Miltoncostaeaceae bacterium]